MAVDRAVDLAVNRRRTLALAARAAGVIAVASIVPGALHAAADTCTGVARVSEATLAEIQAFVRTRAKSVLTFAGYSGAGYEDEAALARHVEAVLTAHDPQRTLVNAGATAEGIGAVYALARRRGFETMGIVSTRARAEGVEPAACVDHVFYVADDSWGGRLEGSERLAPTSAAMVAVSTALVAIGGGAIARDEWLAARAAGIDVRFIAADMNHAVARERATRRGESEPTDFRGALHAAAASGSDRPLSR